MSSETISLQSAADRLGVHYMTAYRYVRLGLLPAHKESGQWRVDVGDLASFLDRPPAETRRGEAPWSERLESRMVAGDLNGSWGVVEAALASGTEPGEVYSEILAPALTSIGERWARGEIAIEDEHLASSVASRLIGRLGPRFTRRGRPKGTVVTAMPPGERHGFGVSMLADILRSGGYEVVDLGPDTPVGSLLATVERNLPVTGVCISVVYSDSLDGAGRMVEEMASAHPQVPVLVGGRAIDSAEVASRLGDVHWADSADEALSILNRLEPSVRTV